MVGWFQKTGRILALVMALCCIALTSCAPATNGPEEGEKKPEVIGTKMNFVEREENLPTDPQATWQTKLPEGYQLLEKNSRFELYTENSEFNLALRDLKTGQIWYSSPPYRENVPDITGAGGLAAGSHLLVNYFDRETRTTGFVNTLIGSVRQKSAVVTKIKGGIRFDFDFSRKQEQFKIPLVVTLEETGLVATVLFDEIEEYGEAAILDISVLPYFGSGAKTDEGWILLPDGTGSVINFNSGRQGMKAYAVELYGRDPALTTVQSPTVTEKPMMPVYGIQKNGYSVLGVAEQGSGLTTLQANVYGIDNNVLNSAWHAFTYRGSDNIVLAEATWTSKDVMVTAPVTCQQDTVSVRFMPVEGEDQQFTGMAKAYRTYLEGNGLTKTVGKVLPTYLTLYGAVKRDDTFLGIPYVDIVSLTTFDQAAEIAAELKKAGLNDLLIRYDGTFSGGLDGAVSNSMNYEGKLGGDGGMRDLLADAKENGYLVYPDVEMVRFSEGKFGWSVYDSAAKSLTQVPLQSMQYKRNVFFADDSRVERYLLDPSHLEKLTGELLGSAKNFELTGISAGSLGSFAYSSYGTNREYDKERTTAAFVKSMQEIKKANYSLISEAGYQYAALEADHLLSVPVNDSGYDISAYRVPFYQMVFSGVKGLSSEPLNLSSNYNRSLLLCLETGTAPQFLLTYENSDSFIDTEFDHLLSTCFADWKDRAVNAWKEYQTVYNQISDLTIKEYKVISDDFRMTQYADGTQVYVNYNAKHEAKADGQTVPAMSYLVVRDGKVLAKS